MRDMATAVAKGSIHPKQFAAHLKSAGARARNRHLILSFEDFLLHILSEFKVFRLVIAVALDSSAIYFKTPQWPYRIFKTSVSSVKFPRMSTNPINLNGVHIRVRFGRWFET